MRVDQIIAAVGGRGQRRPGRRLGKIERQRFAAALTERAQPLGVDVDCGDGNPFAQQPLGHGTTDPAARSRDDTAAISRWRSHFGFAPSRCRRAATPPLKTYGLRSAGVNAPRANYIETLSRHASDFWTRHRRVRAPSPPVSGGYSSALRLSARLAMRGRACLSIETIFFGAAAARPRKGTPCRRPRSQSSKAMASARKWCPRAPRVLEAAARVFGLDLRFEAFTWGCDHHARFGRMMPEDGLARIADHDAIFLGAVGWPTVSDRGVAVDAADADPPQFPAICQSAAGAAVRGVPSPLASRRDIDF